MNKKYLILAGERILDDEKEYYKLYTRDIKHGGPKKWNNYLGVPKHLIPIKGEPLIHRTQRLLLENDAQNVFVTCNKERFGKYNIDGVTPLESIKVENDTYSDHEFKSTMGLLNENGITVILYGDVYYSDKFIKHIVENKSNDWHYYGRRMGSQITGKMWGENFAWYFNNNHIQDLVNRGIQAVNITKELVNNTNKNPNGTKYPWIMEESSKMTYRLMAGLDYEDPHQVDKHHWVEWNDETEDFDFPEDWINWSSRLPHLAYL